MAMTGVERVLKALHREEPDRVPHMELGVDRRVREALFPGASYADFVEKMGLDGNVIFDKVSSWKYETVDDEKRIVRDQWGALVQYGSETLGHPIEPALRREEDLDGYVPPDADEAWRYETLRKWLRRFKGNRAVIAHVTDVFDIARESLLGDVAYYEAMIEDPELIDRVNEMVLDYNLRAIRHQIELGADALAITGDFAMTHEPMVSPRHTARFLIPALKAQVELGHGLGVPVFKHTDGNITKILDLIVGTGIDGLHPIDPMAGMDLGDVKQRYGDRICLMGNIDCGATLSWKSVEEVRAEVKEAIRKAGRGGGYICMSSNSIHSGVKPENYAAMVAAIRELGGYPLDLG